MHDNSTLIRARIRRFVSERVAPAVYRASAPLVVSAWEVPDEPVPFAEARRQTFMPFAVGRRWGKPWGTTWFHVTGTVSEEWSRWGGLDTRTELLVDLGFLSGQPGFQAEGLVFDPAGSISSTTSSPAVPSPGCTRRPRLRTPVYGWNWKT